MHYKTRLYINFGLIVLAFMFITIFFQLDREKRYKTDELRAKLSAYSEMIDEYLKQDCDTLEVTQMLPEDLRFTIINPEGLVIYDNVVDKIRDMSNHADRPEVLSARTKGSGYAIRRSASTQNDYLYYAHRSNTGNYIRLALPYTVRLIDVMKQGNLIFYGLTVVFIVMLVLLLYKTDKFSRVMSSLRRFTSDIEKGAVDYKSFQFPDTDSGIIGKKIIKLYEQLETSKKQTDLEKERNRKLKQEMTNNIAHELKTPVSSIQGYLEILNENAELESSKRKYFVERAYAQTLRLSALIKDIALITKLEEASTLFPREKVNIGKIAEDVINELQAQLDKAGMTIENKLERDLDISGNHNLVHAIFRNLVENSINYAGKNASIIIDCYKEEADFYHFRYYDTGFGVKEKYLQKIFDRFVRLEESRDRRTGGTGLGLSIVKHAVLFHQGSIMAENRAEGGLMFKFSLRKHPSPATSETKTMQL
ncbi:MAG: HAMP domain-containing sensor histidine kinase [Bacteroidales bacterium]|nr:HAMP domain-containing sensor histidine kinase [Bacteroidales bacterium]